MFHVEHFFACFMIMQSTGHSAGSNLRLCRASRYAGYIGPENAPLRYVFFGLRGDGAAAQHCMRWSSAHSRPRRMPSVPTIRVLSRPKSVLTDAFQADRAAGERFEVSPAITRAA